VALPCDLGAVASEHQSLCLETAELMARDYIALQLTPAAGEFDVADT